MSKGFLDHNLFHGLNVTTIHRDYTDNQAKYARTSILCPALAKLIVGLESVLSEFGVSLKKVWSEFEVILE